MLKHLIIENFKAFQSRTVINFAPITLIYGRNSSGKSSIIQSLLLLRQSRNSQADLDFVGDLVDLGSSRHAYHGQNIERAVEHAMEVTPIFEEASSPPGWRSIAGSGAAAAPTNSPRGFGWRLRPKPGEARLEVAGHPIYSIGPQVEDFEFPHEAVASLGRRGTPDLTARASEFIPQSTFFQTIFTSTSEVLAEYFRTNIDAWTKIFSVPSVEVTSIENEAERVSRRALEQVLGNLRWQQPDTGPLPRSARMSRTANIATAYATIASTRSEQSGATNTDDTAALKQMNRDRHVWMLVRKLRQDQPIRDRETSTEDSPSTHEPPAPDGDTGDIAIHEVASFASQFLAELLLQYTEPFTAGSFFTEYLSFHSDDSGIDNKRYIASHFRSIMPDFDSAPHTFFTSYLSRTQNAFDIARNGLMHVSYIGPARAQAPRFRAAITTRDRVMDPQGRLVDHMLAINEVVSAKTDLWLQKFGVPYRLDAKIEMQAVRGTDITTVSLIHKKLGTVLGSSDVGYGISQILPIIVQLCMLQNGTILIEQPELHLHPSMQSNIGSLFADTIINSPNAQIIAETHSEYLVERIQKLVRKGRAGGGLDPSDVSLICVDQSESGESYIIPIPINHEGKFTVRWPGGFFTKDEDPGETSLIEDIETLFSTL